MKPERLSRTIVYESPWVNLYVDKVKFPKGNVIEKFHLLDFSQPAVTIIVENESGNVVLVRICRYATGTINWEVPVGGVEAGESEIDAAKREVLEETGYTSKDHRLIYAYYPMSGQANKLFHVVRCQAVEHVQDFDPDEVTETRWFTKDEVRQLLKERVNTDGSTLTAVLLWLQVS